jgi:tRNA A-37 threonylcarbamoyl transferase component Bud32
MPISVVCPDCHSRLKAPDGRVGARVKCPNCDAVLTVANAPAKSSAPATQTTNRAAPARQDARQHAVATPAAPTNASLGSSPATPDDRAVTDLNLLFGVVALQAALIDNNQFAEACAAWTMRRNTPLADLLVERGLLTADDKREVERIAERYLKRHGGSARASLAAVAGAEARKSLAQVEDEEVQQSLAELPKTNESVQATVDSDVGRRQRFRLQRLHAKGGIGQVWLARDDDLGREVALKELQPERGGSKAHRQRFLAEAQITGQLEHPGIVPVYELIRQEGDAQPCYAMRFVQGRTLTQAVRAYRKSRARGRAKPLDQLALINAFVALCNSVAYANSRGVIHRDLKGQNVVLGDFGEVVVLDWGLAKLIDQPETGADLPAVVIDQPNERDATLDGQVLGTPGYMAPEQAKGRHDRINQRTDVYGLGAVLYEILTGAPPFKGDDTKEVLRQVIEEEPPRPRSVVADIPPALEAICLQALCKRAQDRYASAEELAQDVRRWLADEPVSAYREGLRRRVMRWGRRHPTSVTVAALLLLAVTAAGLWLKYDHDARVAEAAQQVARQQGLVLAALDEATRSLQQGNLERARHAVDQAQKQSANSPTGVQQRVRQARIDLEMLDKLERVLLLETFTAGKHENGPANAAYLIAFQEYGVDVLTIDPQKATAQIKESVIHEHLVTALDDWMFVKPRADTAGAERLLSIAQLADTDTWRQQLRKPATRKDPTTLVRLAKMPEATRQPASIAVHLGKYLAQTGNWSASVEFLEQAQRRHPSEFWVNYALGMSIAEQGVPNADKAAAAFAIAVALRPGSGIAHFGLARQLLQQQRVDAAIAHFRRADEVSERGAGTSSQKLVYFGGKLLEKGKYALALSYYKTAQQVLDPADKQTAQQLTSLIRDGERILQVEQKLPAVLRGDVKPADAKEQILLARICNEPKHLYVTAARFYKSAFAAEPALAEKLFQMNRYNAACAAALAGSGSGDEAARLDAETRAHWRKQALVWLRADLSFLTEAARNGQPNTVAAVHQVLEHWRTDSDLAGIRDSTALDQLPAEEKASLQQLWNDVDQLLQQR